ncbi:MAG: hypothetical protein ACP5QO_14990 [Clostridia bacterium]
MLDDDPAPRPWHEAVPATTTVSDVSRMCLAGDDEVADREAADGSWSLARLAEYARTEVQVKELLLLTEAPTAFVFDPEDLVQGRYGPEGLLDPTLADVIRFRRPRGEGDRS